MKENKLTKYFVFSDVHGEYDALLDALHMAGYESGNRNHKLISLGDSFDRGPKSKSVYEFLRNEGAICVKGNHDVMFQEYLEHGMEHSRVLFNILHNGLGATIKSFAGVDETIYSTHQLDVARKNINRSVLLWLNSMPLYFETASFIFCHAGIHPDLENWKDTDEQFMLWDIEHSHRSCPHTPKTVVIGHHHAQRVRDIATQRGIKSTELNRSTYTPFGHDNRIGYIYYGNQDENRPYKNGNKIAIDGMTNLTNKVNVLVIEDYPAEGRYIKDEADEVIQENTAQSNVYTGGFYQVNYDGLNTMADWMRTVGTITATNWEDNTTITMHDATL